ncbi:hypothetical protein [Pseudoxanthomonas dokdonensis]|uniref:Uncharacterized protein n=1 Tax=Pseudoxanthomonas dokdonensis TaxID=344882 RepID=A0A0R0D2M1_9GAMM|nr:hypothetical protein [Pseudoxanthomonas dokdonensis]KRG71608.1 hypothetical protein ABB29_02275 [Pseudoxanthomonas dokdonensis]
MRKPSKATRELTAQLADLAVVAPGVVLQRSLRLASVDGQWSASDQQEILRMSSEKILAAWQSWEAMTRYAIRLNSDLMLACAGFWLPATFPRTRLPSTQEALTRMTVAGVRPYRRAAKANQRRLGKG